MRERRLILEGSCCNTNLRSNGPKTHHEAMRRGEEFCPRAIQCRNHGLGDHTGCIMVTGQEVAKNVLREKSSVEAEMAEFQRDHFSPQSGWIYSPDGKEIKIIPEGEVSTKLIEEFAHIVLDDADPTEHLDPRLAVAGHDFAGVVAHAMTPDGAIDLAKVQELEGRFGSNGGRGCDVTSGPCSCGAWH